MAQEKDLCSTGAVNIFQTSAQFPDQQSGTCYFVLVLAWDEGCKSSMFSSIEKKSLCECKDNPLPAHFNLDNSVGQ